MKILINLNQTVSCTVETYELVMGLLENKMDVSVILSSHAENIKDWKKIENRLYKVCYIDTHVSKKDFISKTIKFVLSGRKKIKKYFNGDKFDYLINTMGNYWDPLIPSLVDVKQIITYIHDPIAHSGTRWWIKVLRYFRYKQADQIVVHTKSFIPIITKLYNFKPDKIHYIPHSRLKSYKDVWKKDQIDKEGFYKNKTNFIFFGFIRDYKGLHILAKAYKKIYESGYPVSLTIAGSGDFSKYDEEYSKLKNVKIMNRRIGDEEVGNLFSINNAISVLPYLDATQSGVIITSMEFDVPIIASDTGGLKEQLDNGNIGILCNPNDVEDLAEKMMYIIEHPEEKEKQIKLMRNHLRKLDRKVIAKQLIDEL